VPVLPAPLDEGAAVRLVLKGRIGAALLAVGRHPVAFEIAQMGVGRLAGRDPHLRAARPALGIELDDPRLDDDPPRSEPPGGVPLPSAACLGEGRREPGTPAAGIEPPASLPGRCAEPIGLPPALRTAACTCFTKGCKRSSARVPWLRERPMRMRKSSTSSPAIPSKLEGDSPAASDIEKASSRGVGMLAVAYKRRSSPRRTLRPPSVIALRRNENLLVASACAPRGVPDRPCCEVRNSMCRQTLNERSEGERQFALSCPQPVECPSPARPHSQTCKNNRQHVKHAQTTHRGLPLRRSQHE